MAGVKGPTGSSTSTPFVLNTAGINGESSPLEARIAWADSRQSRLFGQHSRLHHGLAKYGRRDVLSRYATVATGGRAGVCQSFCHVRCGALPVFERSGLCEGNSFVCVLSSVAVRNSVVFGFD